MKKYLNFTVLKEFLLGAVLGASPLYGGVYPFGAAYLCGFTGNIPAFALGALVSAVLLGSHRLVACAALIYTAAMRLLFAKRKHVWWRALLPSSAYGALMLITLLFQWDSGADKLLKIFFIILLPAVYTMLVYFGDKHIVLQSTHYLVTGLLICRAFSGVYIFSVPVSVAAAVFLTALMGKEKGFPLSGAAGFVYGLAGGVTAVPVVGIFGLVHGLFAFDSPLFATLLGYMLSVTAGAYILSFDNILPIAISALAGIIIALPFLYKKQVSPKSTNPAFSADKGMAALAAGFSSLSGLFYAVSDTAVALPRDKAYTAVKEKLDTLCNTCGGCPLDKGDLATRLADACAENRTLSDEDMPKFFCRECPNKQEIIAIPLGCALENLKDAKDAYSRFGAEYKCFSNMLSASARKTEEERTEDDSLASKVEKVLEEKGIYYEKVRVTGVRSRRVEIFGVHPDSIRISSGEFSRSVARAVGRCLSSPEFVCREEKTTVVFDTVPALRTESVKLVCARNGEKVSGDTVSLFENGEGCFYSLVADGMGSGKEANMVSRLAALYLEKIIGAGGDMNSALMLLGDTLSSSPGETFTTVDILEADRVLARGKIVKAGAAPSFLLRGGKQYVIRSKTPPLGIIKEVTPKQTSFNLRKGDIILMASDGVDISPSAIQKTFLSGKDLRSAAAALTDLSRKNGFDDDMSVCAVRFY